MTAPFVPEDFVVPDGIAGPGGTLRLLTMDHLAQDFDAYMSSIERGVQNPGLVSIVRIARAMDMTVTELMAEAEL